MLPLTIKKTARRAGGAGLLTALCAAQMLAGTHAASARPAETGKANWSQVIVTLAGSLTPAQAGRLAGLHADTYRHLPLIHALALRLPCRETACLAALPFVRHISADSSVTKCDEFTVGSSGAATAWQQSHVTGQGVTVAVLDSGIKEHEDLDTPAQKGDDEDDASNGSSVLVHTDMTGLGYSSVGFPAPKPKDSARAKDDAGPAPVVYDVCGHGTHVAGIIAGNGRASTGKRFFQTFYGIAPQARLVDVRVLNADGQSDVSTVISGLQWVVAHKATYNIRVINLSLGHPVGESYTTDPLCQAVEAAWKAGIVVVCAAGNNGRSNSSNTAGMDNEGWGTNYGSINSPGNDPCVITVGATKQDPANIGSKAQDRIATYSGRGPTRLDFVLKPDLVAPGNRVISLEADKAYLSTNYSATNQVPFSSYLHTSQTAPSDQYFSLSGTSMAAPVVAGAAALLLQASPSLSPDTVKAHLMLSADKWTLPNGNADPCTFGAGYLDIPAALAATTTTQGPALSPALTQDAQGDVSLDASRSLWGSSLWGTGITDLRAVWGSQAVWGSSGLSADRAVWGSNTLAASRAVWGSSVWGDRAVWGSSTSAVDLSSVALSGEALPTAWSAQGMNVGPDGHMPILWNKADGTVSVWNADSAGHYTHLEYGPFSGWTGTALTTGADERVHLLWTRADNQVGIWTLDGSRYQHTEYGPFPGWTAKALAESPDGAVHILWVNVSGMLSLWRLGSGGSYSHTEYGPFPGWTPKAFTFEPDQTARILWTQAGGMISLWKLGAQGSYTHSEYGPFAGWAAQSLSTGGDSVTHLLWTHAGDGQASLWTLPPAGAMSHTEYGPYPGWIAAAIAAGADGTPHLLWNKNDGTASLWSLNPAGGFSDHSFGPF